MKKFTIIDVLDDSASDNIATAMAKAYSEDPLPDSLGRNLDSIDKARKWLTNPHNWHEGNIFILKWDGLLCSICREQGIRLIKEPWDNGLPEVVVREQRRLRRGGVKEDDVGVENEIS